MIFKCHAILCIGCQLFLSPAYSVCDLRLIRNVISMRPAAAGNYPGEHPSNPQNNDDEEDEVVSQQKQNEEQTKYKRFTIE